MPEASVPPPEFWETVADQVAAKVRPALRLDPSACEPVIAYLRDLEIIARRECDSREVIQIIASGRHLLGDRSVIEPTDDPFSRVSR